MATNYETMKHIDRVGKLLNMFIVELLKRAEQHDQSKLTDPEVAAFTEYTASLASTTYGSKEYFDIKNGPLGQAIEHHYAHNRHHPEFFRTAEEWRPIVGHESYSVSNYGNIKNSNGELLAQYLTPKGYCRLQIDNKNIFIHRLVAEAFIPNLDNKPEVNHIDGVKQNNYVTNLEWVTDGENLEHAYETGLRQPNVKYVVACEQLDIITFGCEQMEQKLREAGYHKARSSSIWRCINKGGKHLDLEFTATRFEQWMNSPINDMTLIDLVEIFCDWKASSERHNDGNIRKSIEVNTDRFGMSPQLVRILENTIEVAQP